MKRRLVALVLALFMSFIIASGASASDEDVHNSYMLQVLLEKSYSNFQLSETAEKAIKALEAASYLAIDQYQGQGADKLAYLITYRVSGLPSSIDDINFTGNQHHRRYTHRGWLGPNKNDSHPYEDDKANWPVRKAILYQTVKKIFNFSDKQSNLSDGFGSLIYYIHVLGDHIVENDYQKRASDMIDVGGRHDENDIIHALIDCSKVIFSSSESSYSYNTYLAKLNRLNGKFNDLVNSVGGVNTDEKQQQYKALAKELMDLLIEYVPRLLQNEEYFTKVFPAS